MSGHLKRFVMLCLAVVVLTAAGLALDACWVGLEGRMDHMSEALSQIDNTAGCPLVDEVDGLEVSLNDLAAEHQADIRAIQDQLQALSHSVGVGDIDVACLYRGYVFRRHNGHVRQAVKDKPVPGGWTPLSPLVHPPSNAECSARFGP